MCNYWFVFLRACDVICYGANRISRYWLLFLAISSSASAGSVYWSDSQRFDVSTNNERVKVTDADGSFVDYTLAIYLPDISGYESFSAYVYSAADGSDKAVTIRKYSSGNLDFMEFIGDNNTLSGDLYLEQR